MTAIAGPKMTSDHTKHTARRIAIRPGAREYWRSSWCPDRALDRNQAITAMTIAELAGDDRRPRGLLEELVLELDITVGEALAAVAAPPHVLDTRFHTLSLSCWCEPCTAIDGHRNLDGTEPTFVATDHDPISACGFLLDEVAL